MNFNDLPHELLLTILGFLDDLSPLATSTRTLSASVRDYRASVLRQRLSRLRHASLLLTIWPPPTFFATLPRSTSPRRVSIAMLNVLCDPSMLPLVESYISSLERKAWVAGQISRHVGWDADSAVITLWGVQQRYSHDPDGYVNTLSTDMTFAELASSEGLPRDVVTVYEEISRRCRPPFAPVLRRGEGLWLYRLVVRDGMESVYRMLVQRERR